MIRLSLRWNRVVSTELDKPNRTFVKKIANAVRTVLFFDCLIDVKCFKRPSKSAEMSRNIKMMLFSYLESKLDKQSFTMHSFDFTMIRKCWTNACVAIVKNEGPSEKEKLRFMFRMSASLQQLTLIETSHCSIITTIETGWIIEVKDFCFVQNRAKVFK